MTASASASKPKLGKIVLAFSGGLDPSTIIPWLKESGVEAAR
jgi:argininosuccinate synthase